MVHTRQDRIPNLLILFIYLFIINQYNMLENTFQLRRPDDKHIHAHTMEKKKETNVYYGRPIQHTVNPLGGKTGSYMVSHLMQYLIF